MYSLPTPITHPPRLPLGSEARTARAFFHFIPSTLISIQNLTHGFEHVFPRTRMARMPL